jgi:hypothetical protein
MKTFLKLPNPGLCPQTTSPARYYYLIFAIVWLLSALCRIEYAHTAFESFLLSGIGLLIFIGFGTDPGIYQHWFKISLPFFSLFFFFLVAIFPPKMVCGEKILIVRQIVNFAMAKEWTLLRDFVQYGKMAEESKNSKRTLSLRQNMY